MSSSSLIPNKKKDILIFGKAFTIGLEHAISAEKMYSNNFTKKVQNFVLVCLIIEQIVTYLLMV